MFPLDGGFHPLFHLVVKSHPRYLNLQALASKFAILELLAARLNISELFSPQTRSSEGVQWIIIVSFSYQFLDQVTIRTINVFVVPFSGFHGADGINTSGLRPHIIACGNM